MTRDRNRDLLDIIRPIGRIVFPEYGERRDYGRGAFGVTIFDHDIP
jgi:hypothetical protein